MSKHQRDAAAAYAAGRWVYAPVLIIPTAPARGYSDAIGEIESAGWSLAHWAVGTSSGLLVGCPVFRRRA